AFVVPALRTAGLSTRLGIGRFLHDTARNPVREAASLRDRLREAGNGNPAAPERRACRTKLPSRAETGELHTVGPEAGNRLTDITVNQRSAREAGTLARHSLQDHDRVHFETLRVHQTNELTHHIDDTDARRIINQRSTAF